MSLDDYRTPSPRRIRLYLGLLLMLVLTAVFGRRRPGDLGTRETLTRSSLARVMFMDVGALSTLGALYLMLSGRTPLRVPAALASLFVGSFALLPALAYEDWVTLRRAEDKSSNKAP
ncbi:hypothetical protein K7W42_21550 [Deinococcus sp. HMF7604]|uniref:hypothetical protein n=1 Tax=Deinococcus betulae TaxID=2873312 RepID=UPI001CCC191E|nr:hypothetical protein [Deinococcus betulae]MBZ9753422.1 hypothetical protein [Deinococcus betulae]